MTTWPDKERDCNAGGFVVFMENTYFDRTARPIYALTFLLPLIIIYEIGTILINTGLDHSQIRVVSFVWIQEILSYLGLTARTIWIGAPLVVIIILLTMQITSRKKWRIHLPDHFIMAIECSVLAVPLIVLSLMLNRPAMNPPPLWATSAQTQTSQIEIEPVQIITQQTSSTVSKYSIWSIIITGIGAGIYEELIFRLVMICLFLIILQDILGIRRSHAIIISVIASALIFSLHHHLIFINGKFSFGEPFALSRFSFRTFAGIYFAILYGIRGFGITAGTHAFYDIIIALMNAFIFNANS